MLSFASVLGFESFGDSSVDSGLEVGGLVDIASVAQWSVPLSAARIFALARLIRDFTVPTSQSSRAAISR